MEINTLDIEKIVKQVMQSVEAAENKPQCSDNCGEGIFPTMEEAIDAAFTAQRKLLDCSMSDKDRFVKAIRNQLSKKENLEKISKMAVEETGMGGYEYKLIKNQGISPKDFEVQTRSVFLCAGERKLCDEFWKGKLKELVVMKEIQEVACEELINPIMQLPSRCGGKDVVLKFLCTEYKAEYILGKMIEDRQFAKDGEYRNNMILLVNSPKGHDNHMTIIPRADCRSIMTDIADDSTCIEELSELTENILGEDQKNAEFDIIKGVMENCNIAAFGSGRLMDVLTKDTIEKMKTKWNSFLEELWEI